LHKSTKDKLREHFLDTEVYKKFEGKIVARNKRTYIFEVLKAKTVNLQTKSKSKKVAAEHYDLGNEFYESMLDKRMQYTCGYFKNTKSLDKAQEQKLDLICKKLKLKKGEKVLELGSGFGWFAKFAAERYGCHVTSYNISEEQVKYAKKISKGLPVKVVRADYREAKGTYDKVVSIGLCEHVGYKNYRSFLELANRCLKDKGLFLLHTIASDYTTFNGDPWSDKYIFPGGMLPSPKQISEAAEGLFILEDWHNLSTNYEKTLLEWYKNFNKTWPKFKKQYGDRFYKMWKYYLLSFAGGFRARNLNLWQVVFSKGGYPGGYESVR